MSLKEFAFNLFRDYLDKLIPLFPDLKAELKQSSMSYTVQEYISLSIFASMVSLVVMLPLMSFIFSVIFADFLFGFMLSVLASFGGAAGLFFGAIQYPKTEIDSKAKQIESALPFAAMYLSTIAGSKLPLYKTFDIFTKFARSGEMRVQVKRIDEDIKLFGFDVGTALQRAIDRSPSKKFREMLYGMHATLKSGGNMNIYLKEKSISLMGDYKRKLYEFSHSLMVFVEIYLTAIILGTIFFTVLTAIISGIAGAGSDIILLQFFLIFVFIPMISFVFIFLIKTSSPGEE